MNPKAPDPLHPMPALHPLQPLPRWCCHAEIRARMQLRSAGAPGCNNRLDIASLFSWDKELQISTSLQQARYPPRAWFLGLKSLKP